MILITGATGFFGRATVDFLLKKGLPAETISVLVRDIGKTADFKTKGVKVHIGDYDDYHSLLSAFKGIDKLLLISGSDIKKRLVQHENAINAAKETGVKHIIYTSFLRKNETETSPIALVGKSHTETERLVKASGIPYTLMLNNLYADMLPVFFGDNVLETGITLPAGEGKASFALRNDMAEAASNILTGNNHENKEYIIANNRNYSMFEIADILSQITGKTIKYTNPEREDYIKKLKDSGVYMDYIQMFSSFAEAIRQGEFETENSDLESLILRKPTTMDEYFKTVYSK